MRRGALKNQLWTGSPPRSLPWARGERKKKKRENPIGPFFRSTKGGGKEGRSSQSSGLKDSHVSYLGRERGALTNYEEVKSRLQVDSLMTSMVVLTRQRGKREKKCFIQSEKKKREMTHGGTSLDTVQV